MTIDVHNPDLLAPTNAVIEVTDDGASTSAAARFDPVSGYDHRLVLYGQIENVRGGTSRDFIQGNERSPSVC